MIDLMSPKRLCATGVVASIAVLGLATTSATQTASVPDFTGDNVAWSGIGGGEFITVPGGPAPVTQDPRYARVANAQARITGEQPNYRISDVGTPNLQQWAREVMQKDNEEVHAGKIAFSPRSTCSPGGVPGFILMGGGMTHFLQTDDQVVMIHDGDAQMRRIYLNVPHGENPAPSWYGESVGHYEGDTLVVDTIGLNDRSFIDAYRTPHTEKLHVTERWRLTDGGDVLEVRVTVTDPGTFHLPWQAIRRYQRETMPFEEIICAENNEQLYGDLMPVADRFDF
jgi:hypothetical protein